MLPDCPERVLPEELDCVEPLDAAAPEPDPEPELGLLAALDPLAVDLPDCGAAEFTPAEPPLPALGLGEDGDPAGVGGADDAGAGDATLVGTGREDNESKVSAAMGDRPTGPELL